MADRAMMEVFRELAALDAFMHTARAELAQLRGTSTEDRGISGATDELDAVVQATETATGTILDSAEALMELTQNLPDGVSPEIEQHAMAIFEACNFQDITGQRITKVVRVLRHVEERIDKILTGHPSQVRDAGVVVVSRKGDDALLNGPARAGQASVDQDEIDRLLSGD